EGGEQRTLTYSELKERSDALARGLLKSGMNKGDRIMILLPRVPEAYIAYMAALKAGLIVLPCSEMLMPSDIRYRMTHAEVKGVIADGALTGRVDEAAKEYAGLALRVVRGEKKGNWEPMESLAVSDDSVALPRVRSDDIAFISYTSGTTGGPPQLGDCTPGGGGQKLAGHPGDGHGLGDGRSGMGQMGVEPLHLHFGLGGDRIGLSWPV